MTVRESYNFGVDTKAKQLYTETTNQGETMVEKRFIQLDSGCDFLVKDTLRNETLYDGKVVDLLNEQHRSIDQLINDEKYWEKKAKQRVKELEEENGQLKEEKELLKDKLDRIEDILPHFLSCAEISEFHSKTFKEDVALMKCWNKRYQK